MIYMYLLPVVRPDLQGATVKGLVVYGNHEQEIQPLESVALAQAAEQTARASHGDQAGDLGPLSRGARNRAGKPWMGRWLSAVEARRTESGTTAVRAGPRQKWPQHGRQHRGKQPV